MNRNIFKRIVLFILCAVLCIPCFSVSAAETSDTEYTYGSFKYTVSDNKVTITGYESKEKESFCELVIPSRINGMKVVAVKKEALAELWNYHDYYHPVSSIVVSDYMTTVDMRVFNYIGYDIKKITLGKYTKKFYQYGKWDYTDAYFRLEEIAVPKDSKYLKVVNGVLYSKDGTTLWAFPAGKEQTSYRVSSNTTTIAKYAFYWTKLKTIKLQGKIESIGTNAFKRDFILKGYEHLGLAVSRIKVPSAKLKLYKKLLTASGIDFNQYRVNLVAY